MEEEKEEKKKSEKVFMFFLVIIIAIFLIFILFLMHKPRPKTIDELHLLNLKGKLSPDVGYIYNGFSFVKVDNLWYTQVQNKAGNVIFDIPLHFGPREVANIKIKGWLNTTLFDEEDSIYITFDPVGQELSYVALAVGEFDQSIIKAFGKIPIAACLRNETLACKKRPIITCNNTAKPVLYVKESDPDLQG